VVAKRSFYVYAGPLCLALLSAPQSAHADAYVYLTQWGSAGSGDGQFNGPWGVAVDASGNVYVADSGNSRIEKFGPASGVGVPGESRTAFALDPVRPNPARGAVALDVTLPDDSPARVELLDVAGRVVRSRLVQGVGAHAVAFTDLASLTPGLYFARAAGHAGALSRRVVVSR
jgi:hypothetical protein